MSAVGGRFNLLVLHLRAPLLCSRHCSSSPAVAGETTPHQRTQTTSTPSPPSHSSRKGDRQGRWGDSEDAPQVRYRNPWKLKLERYRKHISNLVRKSRQAEAVELLEQMKRSKVRPDVGVYNTILSGYGKQGDLKNAFKTFNEIKKRTLLPTDHTYSSMFAACGSAGPSGSVTLDKVMAEMERRNVRPNTIATNSLIAALALCGRQQEAMQVYLDMAKTYTEPDLCTFGALLLAVGRDRTSGLEVAMRVWSEMLASGLKPDLHSYNMVLQVLRDAGLEGAVGEESCVRSAGGEPLKRVVPAVPMAILEGKVGGAMNVEDVGGVKGASAVGEKSDAIREKKMQEEGASEAREMKGTPVRTVGGAKTASVAGEMKTNGAEDFTSKARSKEGNLKWFASGQASKTVLFVKGRVEFALSGDYSVILHVGSSKQEGPPVARWLEKSGIENLFASMKQNHVKPNVHTFQLLVHLTLDPVHLLVTMKERKIPLDSKIMAAAITQQAKQFRNLQGAKVLLQYSRNAGLDLGQVGYQAIASGCQYQREGMQLLMKMKADQVDPNQHVMGTLIGHAVRDHNYEYLTSLIRAMMHLRFIPNSTIHEMLETAAARKVKSPLVQKRLNGFKGFYTIWKKVISPPKPKNEEQYALE